MTSRRRRGGGAARADPGDRARDDKPRAKPRTWRGAALAEQLPVARVVVNKGVLHLDQFFDYAVPAELDEAAQPGVRVRVRFGAGSRSVRGGRREGGRLIDGFVVERLAASDYAGPLAALAGVVSPERVLSQELLRPHPRRRRPLRGSLADVLQLAVPPRSARAESRPSPEPLPPPPAPAPGTWERYGERARLPRRARDRRRAPRRVDRAARAALGARRSRAPSPRRSPRGAGALVVVPDGRVAARVDAALTEAARRGQARAAHRRGGPREAVPGVARGPPRLGPGRRRHARRDVRPGAGSGPGRRSGTTATAATASSTRPSRTRARCCCCAPRTTAPGSCWAGRAARSRARSSSQTGWASPLRRPDRERCGGPPLVRTVGDAELARDEAARAARLPSLAWQAVRDGLAIGPGAGAGAAPGLRTAAGVRALPGPRAVRALRGAAGGGRRARAACAPGAGGEAPHWHCPECGSTRLRAQIVGARRTAEELGRAFPAVPVRTSGRDHILDSVPGRPRSSSSHAGRRACRGGRVRGRAAARRLGDGLPPRPAGRRGGAAALAARGVAGAAARPRAAGSSSSPSRPCGPSRRWCGGTRSGHARRELAERAELGFPPVSRMAAVTGAGGGAWPRFVAGARTAAGRRGAGARPVPGAPPGAPRRTGTRRRGSTGSGSCCGCRPAAVRRSPRR